MVDVDPRSLEIQTKANGQTFKQIQFEYSFNEGKEPYLELTENYFAYVFPPEPFLDFPKHVIFVVDISGSMYGSSLDNTKIALLTLLGSLTEKDHFSIVTFSTEVYQWPSSQVPYKGTIDKKREAREHVNNLRAGGATNICGGLDRGMNLAADFKRSPSAGSQLVQFIFFMTDGYANEGLTTAPEILRQIRRSNLNVPIYGLAFGRGADFNLVKTISGFNDTQLFSLLLFVV